MPPRLAILQNALRTVSEGEKIDLTFDSDALRRTVTNATSFVYSQRPSMRARARMVAEAPAACTFGPTIAARQKLTKELTESFIKLFDESDKVVMINILAFLITIASADIIVNEDSEMEQWEDIVYYVESFLSVYNRDAKMSGYPEYSRYILGFVDESLTFFEENSDLIDQFEAFAEKRDEERFAATDNYNE